LDLVLDGVDHMVVLFQVFEEIADVQEGVTIQADVHERGLHPGEDPGHTSFVETAD
jgi:hypothetical protein